MDRDQRIGADSKDQDGFFASYGWVLKVFASATSVVAGLIAFGFFSEAALYELAGLPRLSADMLYLAEAGARGLVSTVGAIGFEGGLVLLLSLGAIFGVWSLRDRDGSRHLLQIPSLLLISQLVVLMIAIFLLGSLVGVARMGTATGRDAMEARERVEVAKLRDRADWTPRLELERSEELRMAPTRIARITKVVGGVLRYILPPWADEASREGSPSLGFPLRPTFTLRQESLNFYGWLAVGAILFPGAVILLRRWRAWLNSRYPYRVSELKRWMSKKSRVSVAHPDTPIQWGNGRDRRRSWGAFYEASRLMFEPVLILLSLLIVALIPAAHGVLAVEAIGLQPVVVRLSVDDGVCSPGTRSVEPLKTQAQNASNETTSLPYWESSAPSELLPTKWSASQTEPERASAPCTCSWSDLEVLRSEISKYRGIWQEMTLTRPSSTSYQEIFDSYRRAADDLINTALSLRCPEAFRRLRVLLPEPGELESQPAVAGYFIERFGEALTRDGLGLYGHLLVPPRGEEKERLTLITKFGRDRWKLQEIPRSSVAEILLLPGDREIVIEETVASVRTSPVPDRLDELALYPGELTLVRSRELLHSGFLPHLAEGRLITLLGVHGRVAGREASLLREEIVDSLATPVKVGLAVAGRVNNGPADAPKIELAGAAVTSLSSMGGPYAARCLADLLATFQEDPGYLVIRKLEGVPTLVTSAGLLASDLRESLRLYPERAENCKPIQAKFGPTYSQSCKSAEVQALKILVGFLEAAANNSELRADIRRAACSGIGLSLEPSAQSKAFGLAVEAVSQADDELALACLGHTPSRLTEAQRRQLRAFALGKRSAKVSAVPEGLPPLSNDVRRLALAELQEGGLWGEAELVGSLLREVEDSSFLRSVGNAVSDVEPGAVSGELVRCIREGAPEEKRRCLVGGGLVGQLGSTNEEFARAAARVLAMDAEEDLKKAACAAVLNLSKAGDRHALKAIEQFGGCIMRMEDALFTSDGIDLLELLAPERDRPDQAMENSATVVEIAQAALALGDVEEFVEAAQNLAEVGGEEEMTWLASVAKSNDEPEVFSLAALASLLQVDASRWASLAADVFIDRTSGPTVFHAAKFLEDGDPTEIERILGECVGLRNSEDRCIIGLALLSSSYQGSDQMVRYLNGAVAEGNDLACQTLAEWGLRGNAFANDIASDRCPDTVEKLKVGDSRLRWLEHLSSLVKVLESSGVEPSYAEAMRQELAILQRMLADAAELN